MINYDTFMIADSDRGLSRLKLNGLFTDMDGYLIDKVTDIDVRLKTCREIPLYISILHSIYTYDYLRKYELEIVKSYSDIHFMVHNHGFVFNDHKIPNLLITYRNENLIERLLVDGFL